jgi:hypothetical protein
VAKGLARNPLGIIALFIVLIYGFAALTLGISSTLQPGERIPLVWFLVVFPFVVLLTFGWLVSKHHEKLYAPGDYKSDEGFLSGVQARARHTAQLQMQQDELKSRVRETLIASSDSNVEFKKKLEVLVERVSDEIDKATTLTIDARDFLDNPSAVFLYPTATFETLNDLTDEVYFMLEGAVRPFEYGHSWVLRNRGTGEIVKNARMITRAEPGVPLQDRRSLGEVGIQSGTTLIVERAPKKKR